MIMSQRLNCIEPIATSLILKVMYKSQAPKRRCEVDLTAIPPGISESPNSWQKKHSIVTASAKMGHPVSFSSLTIRRWLDCLGDALLGEMASSCFWQPTK